MIRFFWSDIYHIMSICSVSDLAFNEIQFQYLIDFAILDRLHMNKYGLCLHQHASAAAWLVLNWFCWELTSVLHSVPVQNTFFWSSSLRVPWRTSRFKGLHLQKESYLLLSSLRRMHAQFKGATPPHCVVRTNPCVRNTVVAAFARVPRTSNIERWRGKQSTASPRIDSRLAKNGGRRSVFSSFLFLFCFLLLPSFSPLNSSLLDGSSDGMPT